MTSSELISEGFLIISCEMLKEEWTIHADEPCAEKEIDRLRSSANRQTPPGDAGLLMKARKECGLEGTIRMRRGQKKEMTA